MPPRIFRTISAGQVQSIFSTLCLSFFLGCVGHGGGSGPCDPGGPFQAVNAQVTKVNGQPWVNQSSQNQEVSIQRHSNEKTTVEFEYKIYRPSTNCIIQYAGPLTYSLPTLPPGVTASISPSTLPSTSVDAQILKTTIEIPSEFQDGTFAMLLVNQEHINTYPVFSIKLTTII